MTRKGLELCFDPRDIHLQIIRNQGISLYIKVLPDHERKPRYPTDHLYLVAVFHAKKMGGGFIPDRCTYQFFQVLNLHSEKRLLWNWDLMQDAINFYCDNHLGYRYQELNRIENGLWVKWDNDVYFD
jgi:hypothetical protein